MALVTFYNESAQERYDICSAMSRTLEDCVERLKRWSCEKVMIRCEFCSRTDFYFEASCGINGGIVWHGAQIGYEIHT